MKLKLSSLLVIIGIIFLAYYYYVYSPCQAPIPAEEQVPLPLAPPEEELTPLAIQYENFAVTPIDSDSENYYEEPTEYDLAGNVRPDNIMHVEPVTML